jgi:hypothetical protein
MQTHDESDPLVAPQRAHTRSNAAAESVSRSIADPGAASPAALLELQRLAGNASVSRLVAPTDQEVASEDEASTASRSPVLDVVGKGGGAPLGDGLRSEMESRLGADFGDVRVHRDATASESARTVDAHAYTVGSDVVFRSDRWAPDSEAGKHTLAHELTHVMQQRAGPVAGTETGDGIRLSDPADSFERAADRNADVAMSAPEPVAGPTLSGSSAPTSAQRQGDEEEEEELQGEFVQRQGEEEEEEEELQGEFVQRQGEEGELEEEEEEEEVAQGEFVQRQGEEEELEEEKA